MWTESCTSLPETGSLSHVNICRWASCWNNNYWLSFIVCQPRKSKFSFSVFVCSKQMKFWRFRFPFAGVMNNLNVSVNYFYIQNQFSIWIRGPRGRFWSSKGSTKSRASVLVTLVTGPPILMNFLFGDPSRREVNTVDEPITFFFYGCTDILYCAVHRLPIFSSV